jgi:hypothetical protein
MTPYLDLIHGMQNNTSDTHSIYVVLQRTKNLQHQEIPYWLMSMVFHNTYLKLLQLSLGYSISLSNNWDDINFRIQFLHTNQIDWLQSKKVKTLYKHWKKSSHVTTTPDTRQTHTRHIRHIRHMSDTRQTHIRHVRHTSDTSCKPQNILKQGTWRHAAQ